MLFGEWIRRACFWGLDFLKGSFVRKHYRDIREILENEPSPEISKRKALYLTNILAYATKNVPYYQPLKGYASLGSFPVVNKNIIRENYAAFQSPEFEKAKVIPMHTGGSTGTPFVVRQDKNKRSRVFAEMIYLWGKAGYQIGMKYAFFRIWSPLNRFSKWSAWARNVLMIDVHQQDEAYYEYVRRTLKTDRRIKMVISYPGSLSALAAYLLARGDTPDMFHLKVILGFSEAFPDNLHQKLRKLFNCNIVSLYSNQENGLMAMECLENKEFHLNSASYFIELLKFESNEPAGIEELGRIVVTDLFNHAMPLIRYDTGDTGTWKEAGECGWHTRMLASIQGRTCDFIFDTAGSRISPSSVEVLMWPYDELLQYQFIQHGEKQYTLKLNEGERHYDEAIFIKLLKGLVGQDADITIERVSEIPVLKSGKRKPVINNYKKIMV